MIREDQIDRRQKKKGKGRQSKRHAQNEGPISSIDRDSHSGGHEIGEGMSISVGAVEDGKDGEGAPGDGDGKDDGHDVRRFSVRDMRNSLLSDLHGISKEESGLEAHGSTEGGMQGAEDVKGRVRQGGNDFLDDESAKNVSDWQGLGQKLNAEKLVSTHEVATKIWEGVRLDRIAKLGILQRERDRQGQQADSEEVKLASLEGHSSGSDARGDHEQGTRPARAQVEGYPMRGHGGQGHNRAAMGNCGQNGVGGQGHDRIGKRQEAVGAEAGSVQIGQEMDERGHAVTFAQRHTPGLWTSVGREQSALKVQRGNERLQGIGCTPAKKIGMAKLKRIKKALREASLNHPQPKIVEEVAEEGSSPST